MPAFEQTWMYKRLSFMYEILHHLNTLWTDDAFRRLVVQWAEIRPGQNVLDLGTGTGLTAAKALTSEPECHPIGVDLSLRMLQKAKGRATLLVNSDSENLPFPKNAFERVISCYGMGGVENPKAVLQEIKRVSCHGTIVVMAEIMEPPKREHPLKWLLYKFFSGPLFVTWLWGFRALDLVALFNQSGIKVTASSYVSEKIFGTTMIIKGVVE